MKVTALMLLSMFMLCSCKKEKVATPQTTTPPTTQSTCNSEETALLGKWFLKQASVYHADTLLPFSIATYNNAQQYIQFNSTLDNGIGIQTTWPNAKTSVWSPSGTAQAMSWRCAGDTLKAPAGTPAYRVTYISTDSLVLDYGLSADSSQFNRYSLHK